MDKLTSLHVYCRVAELGSFVGAARELNLSATMVSKHVAALERSLGVSLLNRTTRKVNLTDVGAGYYHRCKQLLGDLDELDASTSRLGGLPQGTLRVAAPVDFGAMHMVAAVAAYQVDHPNVVIRLSLDNRHVDLSDGAFDVVIRITDTPEPGLVARVIASTKLCTYASPGYLAKHGEPNNVDELQSHQCLHFIDTPHGGNWIFNDKGALRRIKPKWHFASNNGRALCEAAAIGMGIIHAPDVSVAPYVQSGRLKEILSQYHLATINIYATYLQRRFLPAKISSFVHFLEHYFQQQKSW